VLGNLEESAKEMGVDLLLQKLVYVAAQVCLNHDKTLHSNKPSNLNWATCGAGVCVYIYMCGCVSVDGTTTKLNQINYSKLTRLAQLVVLLWMVQPLSPKP